MQLVKVDMIGLQALQRMVDGVKNVLAVEPRRSAVAIPMRIGAPDHLARQHDLVTLSARGKPFADDRLRRAVGFRTGRDRVKLGRVEEIHAVCHREIHLREGVGFVGLLAKGHGAQGNFRHHHVGAAKLAFLHFSGSFSAAEHKLFVRREKGQAASRRLQQGTVQRADHKPKCSRA